MVGVRRMKRKSLVDWKGEEAHFGEVQSRVMMYGE